MSFVYNPPDGYRNTTVYPTKPENETAFRDSMMDLFDQVAEEINTGANSPAGLGGVDRQAIVNGNFDIWQRGASIASSPTSAYSADRWNTFRSSFSAGLVTTQQDGTGAPGSQFCARVQRQGGNNSTDDVTIGQAFESADSIKFRGQTLTLSFYARLGANFSSIGAKLNTFIISGTGINQGIAAGFTSSTNVGSGSVTLTASWQRFTINTGEVPSNSTQLGITFNYTPVGTAGADDFFEITQVQVNAGEAALSFQSRSVADELDLCQRFYQTGLQNRLTGTFYTATSVAVGGPLLKTMRVNPTLVRTNSAMTVEDAGSVQLTSTNIAFNVSTSNNSIRFEVDGFTGATPFRPSRVITDSFAVDAEM